MRISDWSSDVCSSDLGQADEGEALLRRSLQLDASYPGVPVVTLAFVLSQRGELEEAERILDDMPSPSNLRSDERRVGKECVSTCSSRWAPSHSKKKRTKRHRHNETVS